MYNRIAYLEDRISRLETVITKRAGVRIKVPPALITMLAKKGEASLNKVYNYGDPAQPGSFGWGANHQSALHALEAIVLGQTDLEDVSDAVHRGWSHAFYTIKDPAYKVTILDQATGLPKGKKKYLDRLSLAKKQYRSLPESEKLKDRLIARPILEWALDNPDIVAQIRAQSHL